MLKYFKPKTLKKSILLILIPFFFPFSISAQTKQPENFGYRHLQTTFQNDTIDILLKSKKGDEQKTKPLLLFCQGSQPKPLIIYDHRGAYGVFPFNPDSLINNFHLAIISKPFIPLVCDRNRLNPDFTFTDSTGLYPKRYSERNTLDYYVKRNMEVISFLQKQPWVSNEKLVIAGHSEGSTIAAKLAEICPKITHLIYASGNPMGRILTIIEQNRALETDTDTTRFAEEEIRYWQAVVENKSDMDASQGDTYKATYDFSYPPIEYLRKLKIPVLVCYGTKDWSCPFNDYLRIEMIRENKQNFTFNPYIGTDHNFFPLLPDGKPNYNIFNWDKVAEDWLKWLN